MEQALAALREQEGERLAASYSYLRYHSACRDLRRYACHTRESFYLTGWVPADAVAGLQEKMAQFQELACVIDVADDPAHFTPRPPS